MFTKIAVGALPTLNAEDYPGLGPWWVQLRTGKDNEIVIARIYGDTAREAHDRAHKIAALLNENLVFTWM